MHISYIDTYCTAYNVQHIEISAAILCRNERILNCLHWEIQYLLSISSTNYYWLKIVWIHHHLLKKYCRANLKNAKNKNVFLARKITHLELQRNETKMVKKSWLLFCQLNIYVSILQRSFENHRTAEIRVEIKNIISQML